MRVEHSVIIDRPLDEVFSFAGNPDNDTQWGSLIVASQQLSPGPLVEGTKFQQTATFLGARLSTVIELTAYEPGRVVRYRAQDPVALDHCRTFEALPGGTRLTLLTEVKTQGKFRLPASLIGTVARRQVEADMEELKTVMESRGQNV
jgi:hypothetical protein